jgi:hypothetical protein
VVVDVDVDGDGDEAFRWSVKSAVHVAVAVNDHVDVNVNERPLVRSVDATSTALP